MKKFTRFLPAVLLMLLESSLTAAQPAPELSGEAIMKKLTSQSNWTDMSGDLVLELKTRNGATRIRKLKYYSKKRTENEYQMLMKFITPADVKGTAFLTIEQSNRDDDRYLYLPALRRVKKITASGRGGNFMSSDFTYYDIGKPKLKDWKYRRLTDETVADHDCFVVEALPISEKIKKDTGYGKIVYWIRKDIYQLLKADFYDREGKKWKELNVPGVKKIDQVWFATEMVMKDLETMHTSKMSFQHLTVNTGIPDRFFTVRYLQRR